MEMVNLGKKLSCFLSGIDIRQICINKLSMLILSQLLAWKFQYPSLEIRKLEMRILAIF